ncbi:MAG: MBOAT family protein [Negativicutes bacterium]|nr:MBOAT family protein [Negativicutes bacterium]
MLFNSYEFLFLFLPVVLIGFFALARFRLLQGALWWLALASLTFYAWWDVRYVVLLLLSIAGNYLLGSRLEQLSSQERRRPWLGAGIFLNLSLLGYYKYAGFFWENWNAWTGQACEVPQIVLPLGISFFTFTQLAYLIDAYRGETKGYSVVQYVLFVTFFPHLIAGPILYHRHIIPQFTRLRLFVFSWRNWSRGMVLFSIGLFKKVVIADAMIPWVAPVFASPQQATMGEAWAGVLAYTFQLYFDFSGYSDMAVGLGWLMNIRLPMNFNSPYTSTSMVQLWNRWHMTLVTFLNQYVFLPIGGFRKGMIRGLGGVLLTMLVAGLWHGAGWTYVVWGILNGCFLMVNYLWRRYGRELPALLGWMVTFGCIMISLVFFRATSLDIAWQVLKSMAAVDTLCYPSAWALWLPQALPYAIPFGEWTVINHDTEAMSLWLIMLLVSIPLLPNVHQVMREVKPNYAWALIMAVLFVYSVLQLNHVTEFLYFQF